MKHTEKSLHIAAEIERLRMFAKLNMNSFYGVLNIKEQMETTNKIIQLQFLIDKHFEKFVKWRKDNFETRSNRYFLELYDHLNEEWIEKVIDNEIKDDGEKVIKQENFISNGK